jgi:hypothetical protein
MSFQATTTKSSAKDLRESSSWNPRRHDLDSDTDPPPQKEPGPTAAAGPSTKKQPQPESEDLQEVHQVADHWNPMTHMVSEEKEREE